MAGEVGCTQPLVGGTESHVGEDVRAGRVRVGEPGWVEGKGRC